jgi:hypothetical protein
MNISPALSNDRLCSSLTGLRVHEFKEIIESFRWNYQEYWIKLNPSRVRKIGGGRKGALKTIEEKLFAALMYLKVYPTFDVFGFHIGCNRSQAKRRIDHLFPVLEQTLKRKLVLPERKITSIEEFQKLFPEVKEIMVDATERRIQRPKNKIRQNKTYSGKKKHHARKNIVVSDKKKRILVLSKTRSSRRHDKRLSDKDLLFEGIPKDVEIFLDTGFQGAQKKHSHAYIPIKRTKHKVLTEDQKLWNKLISSIRIPVEHAIGGMKRYQAVTQTFRNKRLQLTDTFILLTAGLWNYHLQQSS